MKKEEEAEAMNKLHLRTKANPLFFKKVKRNDPFSLSLFFDLSHARPPQNPIPSFPRGKSQLPKLHLSQAL